MALNVADITITSLETITAFDVVTGAFKWCLDELQDTTLGHSEDSTPITGKGGRQLSTLKRNKAVRVTGTNGLVSAGLLETQIGSKFENKATQVMFPDYLIVKGNAATTTYKAVGEEGQEVAGINVLKNGVIVETLTQRDVAAKGVFAYNPETKVLTFAEIADGTEIAVYYKREIMGDVLENFSDRYSEKEALYIDAFGEDKCNNIYRVQFFMPKADFNGTFDITMGGDQTVHAFEATSQAGACGTSGALWTYTVFGENTPDYSNNVEQA